jgi:hypothetical protein
MRSSADPGAVAAVSADAGDGESRSGSARRSDSLIEFVKTNVATLPLLILTATTNSDELSYGLNDTAVDGFWIGSNWESTGDPRHWLTCWLRSWTPLHTTEQLHALNKEGDQLQMILDRPARGRENRPAPESPVYRGKYRDDVQG